MSSFTFHFLSLYFSHVFLIALLLSPILCKSSFPSVFKSVSFHLSLSVHVVFVVALDLRFYFSVPGPWVSPHVLPALAACVLVLPWFVLIFLLFFFCAFASFPLWFRFLPCSVLRLGVLLLPNHDKDPRWLSLRKIGECETYWFEHLIGCHTILSFVYEWIRQYTTMNIHFQFVHQQLFALSSINICIFIVNLWIR